MAEISIRIIDDDKVLRMLEELPGRAQERILKPLLRDGARMLTAALKEAAPRESGLLEKSLGPSKLHSYRSGSVLFVTTGVRRGFRQAVTPTQRGGLRLRSKKFTEANPEAAVRNPVKYLHLITGGRKISVAGARKPGGKVLYTAYRDRFLGKQVKATTANPFISRAFDATKGSVIAMITERATDAVVAEAGRSAS